MFLRQNRLFIATVLDNVYCCALVWTMMWIFRRMTVHEVLENADAQIFPSKFPTPLKPTLYAVPRRLFSDPKMGDPEWPLTWFKVFCAGFGARCVRVDKVAMFSVHFINVPLSTCCKIRCVSKSTASSRGSPCDSTAFLFFVVLSVLT